MVNVDFTVTRAVARKIIDILNDYAQAGPLHPLVDKGIGDLVDALDYAQGDARDDEPAAFEITVTGTEMDLPG